MDSQTDRDALPSLRRAPTPPPIGDPYVDIHGVRRHFGGVSKITIDRWGKLGFPEPDLVVNRRRFWRFSTINDWKPRSKK